ncbi:MAG: 2Fe-2S iron-sulfur cluster-binding protein, partial [Acidimicrobiales bacterium]
MLAGGRPSLQLEVDGRQVEVADEGQSLLAVLREGLGLRSPKDGCSPQGQCGCCTVLVDGQPRVACVTPARRVAGRAITTVDGLSDEVRDGWADAFAATGASQCGFCTPGIICRLEGLRTKDPDAPRPAVEQALLAHLCRCTGWRTILDAWDHQPRSASPEDRDATSAATRARLEGGEPQAVGAAVALGRGGFADDTAPADALVAVPDGKGGWALG